MKIRPIGDRILVEREKSQDKTTGGIVLPDNAKEKPQRGLVVAVGNGRVSKKDGKSLPLQVKVGDRVYFSSWAGDEQKHDGKNILLLREDDVLAIIE